MTDTPGTSPATPTATRPPPPASTSPTTTTTLSPHHASSAPTASAKAANGSPAAVPQLWPRRLLRQLSTTTRHHHWNQTRHPLVSLSPTRRNPGPGATRTNCSASRGTAVGSTGLTMRVGRPSPVTPFRGRRPPSGEALGLTSDQVIGLVDQEALRAGRTARSRARRGRLLMPLAADP